MAAAQPRGFLFEMFVAVLLDRPKYPADGGLVIARGETVAETRQAVEAIEPVGHVYLDDVRYWVEADEYVLPVGSRCMMQPCCYPVQKEE